MFMFLYNLPSSSPNQLKAYESNINAMPSISFILKFKKADDPNHEIISSYA